MIERYASPTAYSPGIDRRKFVLGCFVCLSGLRRAEAQTEISDEAIREILRRRIDVEKRATGMAVGIVAHGRQRVIVYGNQDLSDSPAIAANTLFEIGSLTKVFTALLLADMVHRKEVQFDDPVERYLPTGFRAPQRNGRAITLADLGTHTSGLPINPPFDGRTATEILAAMGRYTTSDLQAWLAAFALSRNPGTQWAYSNTGYCLLGLALANRAGASYEELLDRRIIDPLGLKDTTLHPTEEETRRLAVGHEPNLARVPPLDLGIFAPAGALRSTVRDMLRFASALLPDSGSPLEAPAQLLLTILRPAPLVGGEQALGWEVVSGADPFVAKDGVTAGQAASMVLDAAQETGVVVLSNAFPVHLGPAPSGGVGAADLARHLIRPKFPLG